MKKIFSHYVAKVAVFVVGLALVLFMSVPDTTSATPTTRVDLEGFNTMMPPRIDYDTTQTCGGYTTHAESVDRIKNFQRAYNTLFAGMAGCELTVSGTVDTECSGRKGTYKPRIAVDGKHGPNTHAAYLAILRNNIKCNNDNINSGAAGTTMPTACNCRPVPETCDPATEVQEVDNVVGSCPEAHICCMKKTGAAVSRSVIASKKQTTSNSNPSPRTTSKKTKKQTTKQKTTKTTPGAPKCGTDSLGTCEPNSIIMCTNGSPYSGSPSCNTGLCCKEYMHGESCGNKAYCVTGEAGRFWGTNCQDGDYEPVTSISCSGKGIKCCKARDGGMPKGMPGDANTATPVVTAVPTSRTSPATQAQTQTRSIAASPDTTECGPLEMEPPVCWVKKIGLEY